MQNVFVYGTLIFPKIIFTLTGKNFETKNATLEGFCRYKIFDGDKPREYPAILETKNGKVEGKILFNVDKESLNILDFFEENDFERKKAKVLLDEIEIDVFVYVWNPKYDKEKLRLNWEPKEFEEKYLEYYLSKVIPNALYDYNCQK